LAAAARVQQAEPVRSPQVTAARGRIGIQRTVSAAAAVASDELDRWEIRQALADYMAQAVQAAEQLLAVQARKDLLL
jgi:hypothetical protein